MSVVVDVTVTRTLESESGIDFIFGPVVQARTYRNLVYLLVSFPFGLATFVAMIVGLSLGVGTAIVFVGFLILALTLELGRGFGFVERRLMSGLLGVAFEPRVAAAPGRLPARLTDQRAWLTAMYFLVRFPLAVIGFVASVCFLSSLLVMAAPLLYTMVPITVIDQRVSSSEQALLVSLFGCILFLLCVHGVNGLAAVSRRLALAML